MKFFYYFIPFVPQNILRISAKIIVLVFLRPKIGGLENLKKTKGSFILASNHTNEFDPVILLSTFPYRAFFRPVFFVSMAKKHYTHKGLRGRFFYGGVLFKMLGAHPVYFGTKDLEMSLVNHIRAIENGGTTYIFPEGRVKLKEGEVEKKAKGGVAYLSFRTQKDILPVYISGIEEKNFWKELFLFKRRIVVKIGEPIPSASLFKGKEVKTKEEFQEVAQIVLDKINTLK